MGEIVLRVGPAASGWAVESGLLESTFFQSGARAEAAARRLAIELSRCGRDVRLLAEDRAKRLVAAHRYLGV